jgi:hypothetical protein
VSVNVKIYQIFPNSIKGAIARLLAVSSRNRKNSIASVLQTRDRAKIAVTVAKKVTVNYKVVSFQQKLQF